MANLKMVDAKDFTPITECLSGRGMTEKMRSSIDHTPRARREDNASMACQTISPNSEERIKTFPEHTDEQLEKMIAQSALIYKNDWSNRTLTERKTILIKAAAMMREKRDEFARPVTLEMGKLFREAQGELDLSADILNYYAENAETFLAPEKLKVDQGEAYFEREPFGVIFCVEPWNFPYYQLARVAGPNLMLGNTPIGWQ